MGNEVRPTEMAKMFFNMAVDTAYPGAIGKGLAPRDDAEVLRRIAEGLHQMAVGLRATYMEIEEIKEMLRRSKP